MEVNFAVLDYILNGGATCFFLMHIKVATNIIDMGLTRISEVLD